MIEENLKDHKPYGNKWVNNKDPDIYESELNLSNTDAEGINKEDRGGHGGSGQFLKLITKIPDQMDRKELM